MHRGWSIVGVIQLCVALQLTSATTDVIRLGYLTGSRRLPGERLYEIPGRSISGAISFAVDQINADQQVPDVHQFFCRSILLSVVVLRFELIYNSTTLPTHGGLDCHARQLTFTACKTDVTSAVLLRNIFATARVIKSTSK